MTEPSTTQEIINLIAQRKIIHFKDIFTVGKYNKTKVYQYLGCEKGRLTLYINHPEHLRVRDLRLIANLLDVHYLVILRLIDRQLEDDNFRLKRFYPPPQ